MEDRDRSARRGRRAARALRPTVDGLESRVFLSVTPQFAGGRPISTTAALEAALVARATQGGNGFPVVNPSPLLGQGTPTPHELARERFHAYFQGPLTVGPGRFSDQAKIIYVRGLGGSNNFRHGDFQMGIVIPRDPNAPITGEAILEDKNTNSSGIIGLDLTAVPGHVDRSGRPNQFTFTGDTNIYSGIYFINTSAGTVDVRYSKGSATAIFNGRVYTIGLASPVKNSDLYSRGGRITP